MFLICNLEATRARLPTLTVLATLLVFTTAVVQAQPTLQRVGPPGGWVTDLAISASEPRIAYAVRTTSDDGPALYRADGLHESGRYVGTHGSDVWVHPGSSHLVFSGSSRSTDGGESWLAMEDVNHLLGFHPLQPDTVWARSEEGLLVSHDAGLTWETLSDADIRALSVSRASPRLLFGLTPTAVVRSADGGASWTEVAFTNGSPLSVELDPANGQVAFIGSTTGLFRSTDAGLTWSPVLNHANVIRMVIDPTDSDRIYVLSTGTRNSGFPFASVDGGQTWQSRAEGLRGAVVALHIDAKDPTQLYVGTGYWGVFQSSNAGVSWQHLSATPGAFPWRPGFYNASNRPLVKDPGRPGRLFVNPTHQGTLISEDHGSSWQRVDTAFTRTIAGN
jgi:hypothetical protein